MKITEMPRARARAMSRSTLTLCLTPSAAVGAVDAGEDLDQRRLARAVVAEKAVHFAGPQSQGHAVQRDHRAEELADVFELEDVFRHWVTSALRAAVFALGAALRLMPFP